MSMKPNVRVEGRAALCASLRTRGYTNTKMSEWEQRMRHDGTLDKHNCKWPSVVTKPEYTRAPMYDLHCRETSVEGSARLKVQDWQGNVSKTEVGHSQRLT